MLIQDIGILVGIVAGTSGMVLGIIDYLHQRSLTRPRVRVRPLTRILVETGLGPGEIEHDVGIMEIANIGHLPIHASTIGFHGPKRKDPGFFIKNPQPVDGSRWPRTL